MKLKDFIEALKRYDPESQIVFASAPDDMDFDEADFSYFKEIPGNVEQEIVPVLEIGIT